ncbi:histone methyltransferase set2 [Podila minutissima]|uniref:[histone H3]-lysine(36) N-trimethyltransferase n=1 Tax=Podila minutissima TaxID=64525 RepID=A0A9P5SIU7_9FUNG|nr:histone methyltransferase set2 [Podila minutissima]
MLPTLHKGSSTLMNGQLSTDSHSSTGSTSVTSISTSPSSSIGDAAVDSQGPGSLTSPQMKQEEPEICASLASLHASFSGPGSPKQTGVTRPLANTVKAEAPKVEEPVETAEKMDVASPIPLSRLFDFDQGDEGSDQIVLNESERQYQKKLRDEFDAGFKDLKDTDSKESNSKDPQNGNRAHDHGFSQRRSFDSDEDEIRIDDDDDEDRLSERMYRNSRLPPPPPPPPMGPPPIKHLPSALEEAQSTYAQIEYNIYRGTNTGNSPVDDCLPCQCKYNPRKLSLESALGTILRWIVNAKFQMKQNAPVDVVKTEKKGFGLRSIEDVPAGTFVMEYIGEVLPHSSFVKRTREYSQAGVKHFYFMSLQSDEVIDATKKGCLARFINHSCNPNCHLEKWVVGSKLRIGIFTIKRVAEGEELTFDYQFERYGAEAQPCYCGESNCSGFIGGNKRSSATRLDNYNMDEEEDQDEIELENEMSLRVPRKEKGNDGDYEETYEEAKITRGIEDPILMEKLARIMFMKPKVQKSKRLLAKLMATTERACLRRFLVLHGLVILKAWLRHYKDEPDIIMGIMFVLPSIPLLSRNAIEDSQIEETVQEVAEGPECPSKGMAQAVLEQWKGLKSTYRIPKAKKAAASGDTVDTPAEDPTSFLSPAESNGSGSGEGLGKRQFDDDERASTPSGMEKRSKYEDQAEQIPTEDNETQPSSSEQLSRSHSYSYDSPDYYSSREYHREPYGYGREGREGYMYGRSEGYREGSYGRSGEGYRAEAYRNDPYALSRSGYDRSRYDPYRDRERDRYYDYYRDREREREYRGHRDYHDMRDPRDPKDPRDYRDTGDLRDREPRDRMESREPFSGTPRSPSGKDREHTPMDGDTDSRPLSPSKPVHVPDQAQGEAIIRALTAAGHAHSGPSAAAAAASRALAAKGIEEAEASSLFSSRNNSPPERPSPLRTMSMADQTPEAVAKTSTDQPLTAATTASATTTEPATQSADYPKDYRGASHEYNNYYRHHNHGHGHHNDNYHHTSQYYRHPSSYHYSKHHHYRASSRHNYGPQPQFELPPNWSKASDPEGRVYYYNEITRITQWDPPRREITETPPPHAPASSATVPSDTLSSSVAPVMRTASPEPRKPVNIDGYTQEQIQEVIGRAFDKLKQKNLANGGGSAGASVHDVESPTPVSRSNKPLKSMNEKDLKAALSATVVKNMAKYKIKLGSSEAFKKHARRITHLIADKEMRSKSFKAGELTDITTVMKNKIRRFVRDYMTKLFKKQPKEERTSLSTSMLVNGSRTAGSHVIFTGATGVVGPGVPALNGTGLLSPASSARKDDSSSPSSTAMHTLSLTSPTYNKQLGLAHHTHRMGPVESEAGTVPPAMDYGDVEVDDEEDVKYGEGEDDDDDYNDDEVAAVPSSSV